MREGTGMVALALRATACMPRPFAPYRYKLLHRAIPSSSFGAPGVVWVCLVRREASQIFY